MYVPQPGPETYELYLEEHRVLGAWGPATAAIATTAPPSFLSFKRTGVVLGLSEVLLRPVSLALGRLLIAGLLSMRRLTLGLWLLLVPGPLAGGLGSRGRRPGLYLD